MSELSSTDRDYELPALSAADARELARLVGLLLRDQATIESQAMLGALGRPDAKTPTESNRELLVDRAKWVFSQRKRRNQFLPRLLFSEYGWDMLLALYITDFSGGRQSIGKLASWVDAPLTTAIRLIDYLEVHQYLSRDQHPRDRRILFVDLTDKGRTTLDAYFAALSDPNSST